MFVGVIVTQDWGVTILDGWTRRPVILKVDGNQPDSGTEHLPSGETMPTLSTRVLEYWAACLAEEMRLTPPTDADDPPGVAFVADADMLTGLLPGDAVSRLAAGDDLGRPREKGSAQPIFPLEVMVAPWVIQKDSRGHAHATADPEALYWVHGMLAEDGSLTPAANVLPMINRNLLSPSRMGWLVIAEQETWEEARKRKQRWKETWPDLMAEVQAEFLELSGRRIERWLPERYRKAKGIVRRADMLPSKDFLRPIHDACRALAQAAPPLLANVLSAPRAAANAPAVDDQARVGHMGSLRPNLEQAQAISNVAALPDGAVLAVTGPPGTGKTSFLQSTIADAVVRAFLAGESPPVILLTSSNNQAVDNAVEALSPAPSSVPVERGRWIEGIAGYGCRWATGDRARASHQRVDAVAGVLFRDGSAPARREFWLAGHAAWSGNRSRSIPEALSHLRRACETAVVEAQQLAAALQDLRDLLGRGGVSALERRYGQVEASLRRRRRRLEKAAASASQAREAFAAKEAKCATMEAAAREAFAQSRLIEKVLSFVPSVRTARWQRVAAAIRRAGGEIPAQVDQQDAQALLAAYVERLSARSAAWRAAHVDPFEAIEQAAERRSGLAERCLNRIQAQRARAATGARVAASFLGPIAASPVIDDQLVDRSADHLDLVLRRRAFDLAMRAREGEFIESAASGEHDAEWASMGGRRNRAAREKFFRAFCSVVPCLASTVYVALKPWHFDYYQDGMSRPLSSFIDLMIVDEAGQVAPHLGIPLFGLARRAVAVGDVHQLKPIVALDERFSEGLALRGGLSEADLEDQDRRGLRLHGHSVMHAAIAASHSSEPGGVLLRRHFRCAASIIGYCNELVYQNRLIPCVPDDAEPPFPHLGYAHLRGKAERAGSSWRNRNEAAAIARWISDNEEALLRAHGPDAADGGRSIDKVVAVVTPFAAQRTLVRDTLRQLIGERAAKITIDTVHALQGAERPVVIFSPTVTADAASAPPYYDREPSIINVAVSRAKKSFIVIGDMRLCDPAKPTPLGLLGRHLGRSAANRIEGINPFELEPAVQRLVNAPEHDAFLKRNMARARQRVIISSFNAWTKPIKDAGIDRLTSECASRGVRVSFLIGMPGRRGPSLEDALSHLAGCGAAVFTSERVHTKTLVIDDDVISEGSFNWCGTYRDHQGSEERSFALSGDEARAYVEQAVNEFNTLSKTRFAARAGAPQA